RGRNKSNQGFQMRSLALRYGVPCFTNLENFKSKISTGDSWEVHCLAIGDYLKCNNEVTV
ncbi:MAG: hypothetical protein Q8898_08815, partial [Bacillota bacterium]|nr:hypothetical protein [Bacillota bacterium]